MSRDWELENNLSWKNVQGIRLNGASARYFPRSISGVILTRYLCYCGVQQHIRVNILTIVLENKYLVRIYCLCHILLLEQLEHVNYFSWPYSNNIYPQFSSVRAR